MMKLVSNRNFSKSNFSFSGSCAHFYSKIRVLCISLLALLLFVSDAVLGTLQLTAEQNSENEIRLLELIRSLKSV